MLEDRLAAFGEAFLQSFDDTASRPATTSKPGANLKEVSNAINRTNTNGSDSHPGNSDGVRNSFHSSSQAASAVPISALPRHGSRDLCSSQSVASPQSNARSPLPSLGKSERRCFMSAKAGVVHRPQTSSPISQTKQGRAKLTAELDGSLSEMRREVEQYGALGLDSKDRKAYSQSVLSKLKATPDKAMRMPAKLGLSIAKKRAERQAAAQQEAFEAGMLTRKWVSKKRSRASEAESSEHRGLREDGGAFRNGMLRVASPVKQKSPGTQGWRRT